MIKAFVCMLQSLIFFHRKTSRSYELTPRLLHFKLGATSSQFRQKCETWSMTQTWLACLKDDELEFCLLPFSKSISNVLAAAQCAEAFSQRHLAKRQLTTICHQSLFMSYNRELGVPKWLAAQAQHGSILQLISPHRIVREDSYLVTLTQPGNIISASFSSAPLSDRVVCPSGQLNNIQASLLPFHVLKSRPIVWLSTFFAFKRPTLNLHDILSSGLQLIISKTFISKHLGLPPELQSEFKKGWRQTNESTWVSSSGEAPSCLICMMRLWSEGKESIIWNKTFSMSCYRVSPYALCDKLEALRTMRISVAQTASKSGEILLSVRSLRSQTLITWRLLTIFIIHMMKHNCNYVADCVVIVTSLWNTYRRLGVYYFYAVWSMRSKRRSRRRYAH